MTLRTPPDHELEKLKALLAYDQENGGLVWKSAPNFRVAVGSKAGAPGSNGYRSVGCNDRHYREHRVVWLLVHGEWPQRFIDHIDGDRGNNRIENLRLCTLSENNQNRPDGSVVGASKNKKTGKWAAMIKVQNRRTWLGIFDTKEEAIKAYLEAKPKFHRFGFRPSHMGGS